MTHTIILVLWLVIGVLSAYKCYQGCEITYVEYWLLYIMVIVCLVKILYNI